MAGPLAVRTGGGIRFEVRLTPNAGRDAIGGATEAADGRIYLKARVTAIPEKGKANKALIALIARRLKVAKGTVTIVAGETSRIKTVEIAGDADTLIAALEEMAQEDG